MPNASRYLECGYTYHLTHRCHDRRFLLKFARALYAEALEALLAGETAEGLSMLRDLVHAEITFRELARQTGYDEKSLHRMLSQRGNPTAQTLGKITTAIRDDLGFVPRVKIA